jgi:hypothetical protein
VSLVRSDVSEERIASIIRLKRISQLATQKPHGFTFQKTAFFIVTTVRLSSGEVMCFL